MGTRADFYVGIGKESEWIGSIAWDGYPDGTPDSHGIFKAKTELEFREFVLAMIKKEEGTTPDMGWPWPWEDSLTTDYAYAWNGKDVRASCGREWFDPLKEPDEEDDDYKLPKTAVFPNMRDKQNVTLGPRSGLIAIKSN